MRTAWTILMVAAALCGARPGLAQELAGPGDGSLWVLEPAAWTGVGTRGITVPMGPVRVVGLAHHPSGIARVTLNGAPATLTTNEEGVTRFTGMVSNEAARGEVRIVAYPVDGPPLFRLQKPDGSAQTGRGEPPSAAAVAAFGAMRPLRVSLDGLDAAARAAVVAGLGEHRATVVPSGAAEAHLSVRAAGGEYVVTGRDGAERHRVAAPSEAAGTAALLPLLFQELGALQVAEMAPPPSAFALDAAFLGASTFRVGQGIELRVRSPRDGHLTVVDVGTNGKLYVIFPFPGVPEETRVRAGQTVELPSAEMRAQFAPAPAYQADNPTGRGMLRVFVTPRPIVRETAGGDIGVDELLRALQAAVAAPGGAQEPWATVTLPYHIVP